MKDNMEISREQESNEGSSLLLSSEDRASGFSIVADDCHNITLLKWGKRIAWFSPAVTGEVLREFLALVKDCERSACGKVVVELEKTRSYNSGGVLRN